VGVELLGQLRHLRGERVHLGRDVGVLVEQQDELRERPIRVGNSFTVAPRMLRWPAARFSSAFTSRGCALR
jgi:hypothetical protein